MCNASTSTRLTDIGDILIYRRRWKHGVHGSVVEVAVGRHHRRLLRFLALLAALVYGAHEYGVKLRLDCVRFAACEVERIARSDTATRKPVSWLPTADGQPQ